MDFTSFKATKQANSATIEQKPALSILKGQPQEIEMPKVKVGYDFYEKIWQGCGKCGREMSHAIVRNEVVCLGCESRYTIPLK